MAVFMSQIWIPNNFVRENTVFCQSLVVVFNFVINPTQTKL